MIITQFGQEAFSGIGKSGSELPSHGKQSQEISPLPPLNANKDGVQVTLSDETSTVPAKASRIAEKYSVTVDRVVESQAYSDDSISGTGAPLGLHDVPDLMFFNAQDVLDYEERLMEEFSKRGIDTSIPIDLRTDGSGNIVANADHPDKAAIEEMLKEDMDLRNGFIQTGNYHMFKEIYAQHQEWGQKIESGVTEEAAGIWLIEAVSRTVAKVNSGMTFEDGHFKDPFASGRLNSLGSSLYQS